MVVRRDERACVGLGHAAARFARRLQGEVELAVRLGDVRRVIAGVLRRVHGLGDARAEPADGPKARVEAGGVELVVERHVPAARGTGRPELRDRRGRRRGRQGGGRLGRRHDTGCAGAPGGAGAPYRRRGRWVVAARRSAQPPDSHGEDPRPRSVPDRAKHEPVAEEPDPQRDMRTVTLTDEDRAVRAPPDLEVDALALRRAVGDRDADPVAARAQSAAVDGHAVAVASVCLASVVCRRMHRGRGPCRRVREDSECDEDDQQENPVAFRCMRVRSEGPIARNTPKARPSRARGWRACMWTFSRGRTDVRSFVGCNSSPKGRSERPAPGVRGGRFVTIAVQRIRASGSVAGSTGARRRWWVAGRPVWPRQGAGRRLLQGRGSAAMGPSHDQDGQRARRYSYG